MRVATRRQRAAWRVFGRRSGRPGPSATGTGCGRSPRASGPCATSTSCSRRSTPTGRTCRSPSGARWSRCSATGGPPRRCPCPAHPRAGLGPDTSAGSTTTATSSGRRAPRSSRSGRPSRIASATPRHRASGPPTSRSAATSPSCAGPTSRRCMNSGSPGSGCATRSSSCARRSSRKSTPLLARVTALQDHLGLMNDADVAASMARTFLVEHAGDLSALESAAIGRYLISREKEVARLRRTIAVAVAGRGRDRVPAGARAGRLDPLTAGRLDRQSRQPCARLGSRSRQPAPT